jgi:anthranilate synthase component 2
MILVIDNYDSFTFNLVQLLGSLGADVEVRRNDELDLDGVASLGPERIVVSPGPCTPTEAGISVDGNGLFEGVPSPTDMTRYHSLILEPDSIPRELEVIAWTAEEGWEDEVQAVRHTGHPVWGVQFHPESVASPDGRRILANFLALPA